MLFCDLVESVALSTRLDPEDYGEIMRQYEDAGDRAMAEFGGHVAQYLGDGLVVYFGYPTADEHAAANAVRAGLRMLERVAELDATNSERLAARVGIHTGEAVVTKLGRGERRDDIALGDVVNIAARTQSEAPEAGVAISAATYALVSDQFRFESLGRPRLKGVAEPFELFSVTADIPTTHASTRTAPLLGRDQELELLTGAWARARAGQGQIVHITGPPGIGKTRLVTELRDRVRADDHLWGACAGAPHLRHTPLAAFSQLVHRMFAWTPDTPADQRLDTLDQAVAATGSAPAEAALIADALHIDAPPGRFPRDLRSAEAKRDALLRAVAAWALAVARQKPLVVLVEDLQWVDRSSLDLLGLLAAGTADAPVLIVTTAREEGIPPWAPFDHEHALTLEPLSPDAASDLIRRLRPGDLDDLSVADLVERTRGIPLFLTELGRSTAATHDIPLTLRDSLMARIDALGSAKAFALVAAVLGSEFPGDLARTVAAPDVDDPDAALAMVLDSGVVVAPDDDRPGIYRFEHALLQETAYASLVRSRRRELHARVADALTDGFEPLVGDHPELVARHLGPAGRIGEAVAAWERAAERAQAASAYREAAEHLEAAISLVEDDSVDGAAEMEMRLQIDLGRVRSATHGFASEESAACFARASELAAGSSDPAAVAGTLFGAWSVAMARGAVAEAGRLSVELERIAPTDDGGPMAEWTAFARAAAAYATGDLTTASDYIGRIYDHDSDPSDGVAKLDVRVAALIHRVLVSWHLGRATEALEWVERYLPVAEAAAPWNHAHCLMTACVLNIQRGDVERVTDHATTLAAIAREHALPTFVGWERMYLGWAAARSGRPGEAVSEIREGLAAYLATGQRTGHPNYLGWLADAHLRAGDRGRALANVRDAREALPEEVMYEPELCTVHGDIVYADDPTAARDLYRHALDSATRLGSVPLTLVAALRLATCGAADPSEAAAARDALSFAVSRFEPDDTFEALDDARRLLNRP